MPLSTPKRNPAPPAVVSKSPPLLGDCGLVSCAVGSLYWPPTLTTTGAPGLAILEPSGSKVPGRALWIVRVRLGLKIGPKAGGVGTTGPPVPVPGPVDGRFGIDDVPKSASAGSGTMVVRRRYVMSVWSQTELF